MAFKAKARRIPFSPYKMRPLADVIRGKSVEYALNWLATCPVKRALPIHKVIKSAADNAKQLDNVETNTLFVKEICIDEGPSFRYFKPGAMGRSNVYKRRSCHISVVVEPAQSIED